MNYFGEYRTAWNGFEEPILCVSTWYLALHIIRSAFRWKKGVNWRGQEFREKSLLIPVEEIEVCSIPFSQRCGFGNRLSPTTSTKCSTAATSERAPGRRRRDASFSSVPSSAEKQFVPIETWVVLVVKGNEGSDVFYFCFYFPSLICTTVPCLINV